MAEKFYNNLYETYPRIYVTQDLAPGVQILLSPEHAHYLKNVLRREERDFIRMFNGRDGEWLMRLDALSKKSGIACAQEKLRHQPNIANFTTLYFAPIKKTRLDILIEKAVELGVHHLCPVITARTENRKLKMERMCAQVIEAAEQCERLDMPIIHDPIDLFHLPQDVTIHAGIERDAQRGDAPLITSLPGGEDVAFLIGSEGGFTDEEVAMLSARTNIRFISLGDRIYRAETAAILCLSHVTLRNL